VPEPRGAVFEAGGALLCSPSLGRELGGELGGAEGGTAETRVAGWRCIASSTWGEISEKPRVRSTALVRSKVTVASAAKPSRRCSCISSSATSTSIFEVPGSPSIASVQAARKGATARFVKSAI
jgi:hypothetical protein